MMSVGEGERGEKINKLFFFILIKISFFLFDNEENYNPVI